MKNSVNSLKAETPYLRALTLTLTFCQTEKVKIDCTIVKTMIKFEVFTSIEKFLRRGVNYEIVIIIIIKFISVILQL